MIIDAHNHPDWHGHDLPKYLANMDRFGINRTWLLTWECPPDEYYRGYDASVSPLDAGGPGPIPFARCLSYCERAPDRFVPGYAPDPRRPDAINRLAAAVDIHGVRLYGELEIRTPYDNPDALRLFRFCGKRGLPVIVHLDEELGEGNCPCPWPNWWYGGGIDAFERAVSRCPDTVFLGHGPGFWAYISGDRKQRKSAYPNGPVRPRGLIGRMLRKYPNLYCDLSAGSGCRALDRDHAFARDFLFEFQDRVLYARDYFDNRHQEMIEALGLSEAVRAKIYADNALKLVPV